MPVYNLSIPASSPFIKTSGNWQVWDDVLELIPGGSSPEVSFDFNGTGLYLSGSRNDSLECNYSISIDGNLFQRTLPSTGNHISNNEIFFTNNNLPSQHHTVKISALSSFCERFGLNYVNFTAGDGHASTKVTDISLNFDNINNVTLAGSWNAGTDGSATKTYNASVGVSFYGNGISVYGYSGPQFGPYSVSLDGGPLMQFTSFAENGTADPLLFVAHNLSYGAHDIVLVNNDPESSSRLGFTRAIVSIYETSSNASTNTTSTDSPSAQSSGSSSPRKSHTGAIAGGAIGGIAFLCIIGVSIFICARRYRRRRYAPPRLSAALDDNAASFPANVNDNSPASTSAIVQAQMEEVDMPPPNYKNVFPSEHGGSVMGMGEQDGTTSVRQTRDQPSAGAGAIFQGSSRRNEKRSRYFGTDSAATVEVSNSGMHSAARLSHNTPRFEKR